MNNSGIMEMDDEMISVSPIFKSTPINNKSNDNSNESSPPSVLGNSPPAILRPPALQQQHSYAGHEEAMTNDNTVGSVARAAPSGRPFLATRHLSMEDHHYHGNAAAQWTQHPAIRNHYRPQAQVQPQPLFHSPVTEQQERQQPPASPAPSDEREETAEERAQREEEESIALAQMLMAEEAMASHRMSADFLRMNSAQFSEEDYAALQDALREEEDEEELVSDSEDVDEDMSYDALLRLGERIGDVKTDRWTMIAHKEIAKLETFVYDPSKHAVQEGDDAKMEDIDDSEIKCLICQFPYEEGDQLRRLPCSHCVHRDCVDQWLRTKDCCAYCRQCIVPDKDENKNE